MPETGAARAEPLVSGARSHDREQPGHRQRGEATGSECIRRERELGPGTRSRERMYSGSRGARRIEKERLRAPRVLEIAAALLFEVSSGDIGHSVSEQRSRRAHQWNWPRFSLDQMILFACVHSNSIATANAQGRVPHGKPGPGHHRARPRLPRSVCHRIFPDCGARGRTWSAIYDDRVTGVERRVRHVLHRGSSEAKTV